MLCMTVLLHAAGLAVCGPQNGTGGTVSLNHCHLPASASLLRHHVVPVLGHLQPTMGTYQQLGWAKKSGG